MTYQTVILASWAVFILVWIIASFNVKRDIKGGGISAVFSRYYIIRLISIAFIVFIVIRTMTGVAKYNNASIIFENYLFTPSLTLGWIAAGFVILGVVFAIWARFHLGRNWSGVPSVKENHELITSGPYRFVRHPIYTGVLLAAFGAALSGTMIGLIILLVSCIMFMFRIPKEEKIMLDLFPGEYPAYKSGTKRLIPFVW